MRRKGGGQLITKHTSIQYINPTDVDGRDMYELVKSSTLDSNSPYCYIMMSKFFKKTCIVAKAKETLAGFVTGFVQPDHKIPFLYGKLVLINVTESKELQQRC